MSVRIEEFHCFMLIETSKVIEEDISKQFRDIIHFRPEEKDLKIEIYNSSENPNMQIFVIEWNLFKTRVSLRICYL